jgi:L-alanine-DL-glutamate epimerase-like enolase superfamily enzyme
MATFDRLADLPLEIEGYELQGQQFATGRFERLSTTIHIRGGGEDGLGEDVTYDALDHVALQDAGPALDLTGHATLGEFCDFMAGVDTFPVEPQRDVSRRYRRWAFESAALDLALRQSGIGIAEALGREARPVTFVCSMGLSPGEEKPSTIETLRRKLDPYPGLRFKLDAATDWDDELIAQLVESGAVDSFDLKSFYKGTPVDVETDPELYAKLVDAFPDAWLEDADVIDETRPILEPVHDRLTWDAPIHSIDDIQALPWEPKMVNIKPSRIGGLRDLCAAYDYCDEHGIGAYGGGQWELGVGRGQIQVLASLFHPDTPNDIAPRGYNEADPPPGLPTSPMEPELSPTGFRWDD